MILKLQTFAFAISFFFLATTQALAGGWTTGGGTAVKTEKGLVLADLLTADPLFEDSYSLRDSDLPKLPTKTKAYKKFGYEILDVEKLPAWRWQKRRLAVWESSNGFLIDLLRASLEGLRFRYSSRYAAGPAIEPWIPPSTASHDAEPMIFYRENFGAIFRLESYLQLGDTSRAGAILHEAARRFQLELKAGISEEALHTMVGTIMVQWPKGSGQLETPENLGTFYVSKPDPFSDTERKLCKDLTEIIELAADEMARFDSNKGNIILDGKSQSCSGELEEKFTENLDTRDYVWMIYHAVEDLHYLTQIGSAKRWALDRYLSSLLSVINVYNLRGFTQTLAGIAADGIRIQNVTREIENTFGLAESALLDHYNGEKVFRSGSGSAIRQGTKAISNYFQEAIVDGYLIEVK